MNITLASCFRNSTPTLQRYFRQCDALDTALYHAGHKLSFIWGEGDSTDGTLKMLHAARWRFKVTIVDCTHGGSEQFGSVVRAERFKQLAHVGRVIFGAIPADCDIFVYVESDLIFEPATIVGLIERVGPGYEVIAPPIVLEREGWPRGGKTWYDTFAFTRNGRHFEHRKPWHPDNDGVSLLELDTAGSCLAMSGADARGIAFDERVLMGVCAQIRERGGSVWFDPTLPPCVHN